MTKKLPDNSLNKPLKKVYKKPWKVYKKLSKAYKSSKSYRPVKRNFKTKDFRKKSISTFKPIIKP